MIKITIEIKDDDNQSLIAHTRSLDVAPSVENLAMELGLALKCLEPDLTGDKKSVVDQFRIGVQ